MEQLIAEQLDQAEFLPTVSSMWVGNLASYLLGLALLTTWTQFHFNWEGFVLVWHSTPTHRVTLGHTLTLCILPRPAWPNPPKLDAQHEASNLACPTNTCPPYLSVSSKNNAQRSTVCVARSADVITYHTLLFHNALALWQLAVEKAWRVLSLALRFPQCCHCMPKQGQVQLEEYFSRCFTFEACTTWARRPFIFLSQRLRASDMAHTLDIV